MRDFADALFEELVVLTDEFVELFPRGNLQVLAEQFDAGLTYYNKEALCRKLDNPRLCRGLQKMAIKAK